MLNVPAFPCDSGLTLLCYDEITLEGLPINVSCRQLPDAAGALCEISIDNATVVCLVRTLALSYRGSKSSSALV
jgi:hypothetical protein